MQKAVNAWAISEKIGFEETFRKAKEAGFECIELNLDSAGAHSITMDTTPADCARIAEISRRAELPVSGLSTSMAGSIASEDSGEAEQAKRVLRQQLKCAASLGAPVVLSVPGGGDTPWGKAQENGARAYREMRSEIEESGVAVGLEHVWNGYFLSPRDMTCLIDAVDSPSLGAYFDIGNCADRSKSEDWIRFLGHRIVRVHIKNFMRTSVFQFSFPPLYEAGTIAWEPVMAALREIGYDKTLTAEYGAPEGDPSEELRKNADAITRILKL